MANTILDFEKGVVEAEKELEELKRLIDEKGADLGKALERAERKARRERRRLDRLTRWQRTQLSRHPDRPHTLDYIGRIFTGFTELHGDRAFRDDPAIVGGMALLGGTPVMVMGHEKGRGTTEKVARNFGMASPEGYRKALRLMKLAEKFARPIITLVDTPGAYPGIGAEERGQAEAIARNLLEMAALSTPLITVVIGEGGSGGALALAMGNRVLMLENSIYSVISPEGCAAILWKDGTRGEQAAEALKLTARDLEEMAVVDEVIKEPAGGAHRDHPRAAELLAEALARHLAELRGFTPGQLITDRQAKFRRMGSFIEA